MSKQDLLSMIPFYGKKMIEKDNDKNNSAALSNVTLKSVEEELPFMDILDNMVMIDKGKYCVIARTNAISLDDMNEEDQDNILSTFADFTNSLVKPYQIFIPSFTLDIRNQVQMLENRYEEEDSESIKRWINDDKDFQIELVEENDIIDTQFYFVFTTKFRASDNPERDYFKAKKELSRYIKVASDDLEGIGLKIKQLKREEITKLYYYFLNPFSAGIQEPEFNNQIIISEKVKSKRKAVKEVSPDAEFLMTGNETDYLKMGGISLKNKISPYSLNDKESGDYLKIGSTYITIYEIYDYPQNLPRLWAKKLYKYRNNIDISMHIKPIYTSEVVNELDSAALKFGSAMVDVKTNQRKKAVTTIEKKMEKSSEDIDYIIDELDSGEQAFFHYSMYVMAKAKSLEELNDLSNELEIIIGGMRVLFRKCSENLKNALWTMMPIGLDILETTRNMLTSSIANSFPFTNFTFTHQEKEKNYFVGTHKYNYSLIHFNNFELESPHYAILGVTGAGKGMTGKKIIKGMTAVMDIPVKMLDPDGETCLSIYDYDLKKETTFAESMDFDVINYYVGSNHKINILEPEIDPDNDSLIKPQINFIKSIFDYMFEGLQKSDRNILDYSLLYLYNEKGFTDDKDSYWDESNKDGEVFYFGKPRRKPPELIELYNLWFNNELKDQIGVDTINLANNLREWTRLGTIDIFDGQTTIPLNKKRIIFNLKQQDKLTKLPSMAVLFNKLWGTARTNPLEYKLIHAFEAHTLFRNDQVGEYVLDIVKRLRKFGGCFGFDTQNVTDLLKTKYGPEVLKSCPVAFLLKQNKLDAEILRDIYKMTNSEALKMTTFNPNKGEAYFVVEGNKIPVNVKLSEKELYTFTTNPKHLQQMAKMKERKQ